LKIWKKEHREYKWLKLCFAQRVVPDQHPLFISFVLSEICYYMPLGWGGWTVVYWISWPVDFTNSQYLIYNYHMSWLIVDWWPSGRKSGVMDP